MNAEPREWWRPEIAGSSGAVGLARPANAAATSSALPFWALIAFTFVLLLAPQNYVPILATFRLALVVAAVAIGSHVYDRIHRGQPLTILSPEIRTTGWLLGWSLATLPFSYWPGGSVSMLLDLYLKTLAIFLLIGNTVNSVPRLVMVASALTFMGSVIALTGVQNYLAGAYIMGGAGQSVKRIIGHDAGITKNPNDLALVLNLILPLSLALLLIARRMMVRGVLLAAIGLQITGIIITASRAGFLSLAATMVAYLCTIWRRPERGWAYAGVLLLLACLPFLSSEYLARLATIANIEADSTGSAQERYTQQLAAVHFVLAHPIIGAGIGMNNLAMHEMLGDWLFIHNVYLQYATDLGFPGLILFVALLTQAFRSAWSVRRRTAAIPERRDLFYLATGLQMSLLAFSVSAFFSPVAYHFQFYYFAGLAVAVYAVHERLTGTPEPASEGRQSWHP